MERIDKPPSLQAQISYQEIPTETSFVSPAYEDWRWQFKNRIRTYAEVAKYVHLTREEELGLRRNLKFPFAVTPYFLSLVDPDDPSCPIRRQVIPLAREGRLSKNDMSDPLGEHADSVFPWLVHRYPDRVLFLVTDQCATYCRHCTRRRIVGKMMSNVNGFQTQLTVDYLRRNPQVRDVIVSGGDPLILGDQRLDMILKALRSVPTVEIIRIGTRVPCTMPMRITKSLIETLKRYHPIYINVHFNHPKEITTKAKEACEMLVDGGFPVSNQTVLLRGINDDPLVMRELVHKLLLMRVRPYYIFQCDLAEGIGHFRTKVSTGIEIMRQLQGFTSGLAVPKYVIDAPGGGGKIPVGPEYIVSKENGCLVLRNYEGKIYQYFEPSEELEEEKV